MRTVEPSLGKPVHQNRLILGVNTQGSVYQHDEGNIFTCTYNAKLLM